MWAPKFRVDWVAFSSSILAFLVYLNSFKAGFVYDDNRAILTNQDVLPESPWAGIWTNDFWGTPLSHSGSHKSFRPLTTFSFRVNCYFSGFNPWSYHVTNVLLHSITTWLFVRVARIIFRVNSAGQSANKNRTLAVIIASLLFACHPIHSEAVAGVVGRADVGSTAFALSAFLSYVNHIKHRDKHQKSHKIAQHLNNPSNNFMENVNSTQISSLPQPCFYFRSLTYLACTLLLAAASMFTKEQGITILLVCTTYDFIRSITRARKNQMEKFSLRNLDCLTSLLVLALGFITLTHLRLSLMGGFAPPNFSKADNPTAHHPSFYTRFATFLFLPLFNLYLLLYPSRLSYDWSMESVSRIERLGDWRNLLVVLFYFFLIRRTASSLRHLLQTPPESDNSVGKSLCNVCPVKSNNRKCANNNNSIMFSAYHSEASCSSIPLKKSRLSPSPPAPSASSSSSSSTSYSSYLSCSSPSSSSSSSPSSSSSASPSGVGSLSKQCNRSCAKIKVNPGVGSAGTGKVVGYKSLTKTWRRQNGSPSRILDGSGAREKSHHHGTLLIQLAFLIWPFLPATNLFFYVGFVIAERVLYMPSVGFSLLIGHGFLRLTEKKSGSPRLRHVLVTSAFITLLFLSARTVRRNEDWRDEEELYSSGITTNPPKSWGNLGIVLSSQGRASEAEVAYRQALRFRSNMADVHYNLGLVLEGQGRLDEALTSYRSAIRFRPLLAPAYVNAGQVLSRLGKTEEATELYKKCYHLPDDGIKDLRSHTEAKVSAFLRHGKLLVEQADDPKSAIILYRKAIQLMPPNFSHAQSIYNAIGEALSRSGEAFEAEEWFKKALKMKPDHIPAHLTYGKMLARNKTRLLEAETWFRRAKKIAPADATVYQHYGQFLASQGRHSEAAESYIIAHALTPNDYEVVVGAANCLRQAGDNQMAEIYYQKAVSLRPQEARAHMNLGAILHLNRKYAEAERRYLKALELNPKDYMTRENLKKLCQLQSRKKFMLSSCSSF